MSASCISQIPGDPQADRADNLRAAARINAAEAAIYGEIAALDVHESDEGVVAIDYCCRDDPYIREICL